MNDPEGTEGGVSGGGGVGAAAPPSRNAPRLSYEAVVRLSCAGRRGIHTGFVRDIGRGGMFLRLVDPEPVGRRLGFELFLPGWRVPARGVGEVVWQRPSYEGPGRPPGMAIRFVALEARAIEMLAAVLPGGEAPVVEVLQPRPLPPVRRDEKPVAVASVREAGSVPPGGLVAEPSLEALLANSGLAMPTIAASQPVPPELDEDGAPMIFVPPSPLAAPVLTAAPAGPEVRAFAEAPQRGSRLRWGSAAAGIAAVASLATMVIVGAARLDVLPTEHSAASGPAVEKAAAQHPPAIAPDLTRTDVGAVVAQPPAAPSGAGTAAEAAAVPNPLPPQATAPNVTTTAPGATAAAALATTATRLTGLRWEPLPAAGTRVTIALDGSFALSRLRASRIGGDSPRLVVRLLGLGTGAPRAPWEPSTPEVRRIRAGRHDGDGGPEIHLVLDLADANVRLTGSEVVGAELHLDLGPASPEVR